MRRAVGTAPTDHLNGVAETARRRGIDPALAAGGYSTTAPIKGAQEFTTIPIWPLWQLASGFAHGRPWAYHGFLERETLNDSDGHPMRRLRPRAELTIWLPLQAIHLLAELLRLRDDRAGLPPAPTPDDIANRERQQFWRAPTRTRSNSHYDDY